MAAKLVQIGVWVLCGDRGSAADCHFLGFSKGNLVGLELMRETKGFELVGLGELRIGKVLGVRNLRALS